MMMRSLILLPMAAALAACSSLPFGGKATEAPPKGDLATEFAPKVAVTPLGGSGQSAASFDTTSEAEKRAALAASAQGGERELGRAVVALGAPAEAGLWVATGLVSDTRKGRVTAPNGQSLAVELRPSSGAALMSLSAYQALGISLTELPSLTIYAN